MTDETPVAKSPSVPAVTPERRGLQAWHAVLAAAILGLAAFFPAVNNGLTGRGAGLLGRDATPLFLVENSAAPLAALGQLWTQPAFGSFDMASSLFRLYRPLTSTVDGIQVVFSGRPVGKDTDQDRIPDSFDKVQPWHFANLLLYAGLAAAAAALAFAWTRSAWMALAVGVLFAVHPIHAEAVGDLGFRGLLVAGLLGFLGLRLHALATSAAGLAGGGLLVAAACLAHEFAPGFILAGLTVDALLRPDEGRGFGARLARRWAFYAVGIAGAAVSLGLRASITGGVFPAVAWVTGVSNPLLEPGGALTDRILGGIGNFGRMWRLALLPLAPSLDYSARVLDPLSALDVATGVAALVLPFAAGLLLRPRTPLVLAGVVLADVLFLFSSNLVVPAEAFFADRYLLWPSLGVILAFAGLLGLIRRQKVALAAAAAVIALPAIGADWSRIKVWKSDVGYVEAAVADTTRDGSCLSSQALFQRAGLEVNYYKSPDEARTTYEQALDIYPNHLFALVAYADLLVKMGQSDQDELLLARAGEEQVKTALVAFKDFGGESRPFGEAAFKIRETFGYLLHDWASAYENLRQLRRLVRGESSWLNLYLGECALSLGELDNADDLFLRAQAGAAENVAYLTRAYYLRNQQDLPEEAYAELEKISRDDEETWPRGQMATALMQLEDARYEDAVKHLQGLVDDPRLSALVKVEARFRLSEALVSLSDSFTESDPDKARQLRREARSQAEEGLRQAPGHPQAIVAMAVLANLAEAEGDYAEAMQYYNQLLQVQPENVVALTGVAKAAMELRRFDEALSAAERAADLEPENLSRLSLVVEAAASLKDTRKAWEWITEYRRRAVDSGRPVIPPRVQFLEARILLIEGQAVDQGQRDDLVEGDAPGPAGRAAAAAERYEQALKILDELLAKNAGNPEYLRERGLVKGSLGKAADGLVDLEAALSHAEKERSASNMRLRKQLAREIARFQAAVNGG